MAPPPGSAALCDRCRVLEFDDSAFGTGIRVSTAAAATTTTDGDGDNGGYLSFRAADPGTDSRSFLAYDARDTLPALPVLGASAAAGCAFCGTLRASILRECRCGLRFREDEIRIRLQLVFSLENDGRFVSVLAHIGSTRGRGHEAEAEAWLMFGVDGVSGDPCSRWLGLQSSPQEHPLCDRNVEKLRAFIRDTEARAKPRPAFCPTRLIRIGDDKGKEDICYLVIPGPDLLRDKRPLRYAALSYCWGPLEDAKAQFKTERASLPDRVSGFRPEETSPVMRDAVEVCRALDIRYLWVDAVCIVQDDRVDWERESAEMTNIYRGACLTICTPTSTSCREGFLERRVLTVNFRSKIDRSVVGSYTIRSCGAISDPRVARGVYGELDRVDTSPLSNWWKRGWTYQELRLSRRVLLFGNKLLVDFENRVWSENDEEMIEVVTGEVSAEGREDRARGAFAGISLTGQFDLGDDWMSTVEEYSARQLTFETDKLPAMAGLARMEVQGGGELYLAGIRRKSVHRDVFWTPEPRTGVAGDGDARVSFDSLIKSLNSPQPYVAPSWSWARWRGKVRFDESPAPYGDHVPVRDGDACFARAYERIDVWTSASESNPFGQVTGGSLKITSTVVPMLPRLQRQEGFDNHWEMYEGNGYVANISFDWDEPEGWVPYERLSLVLIGSYWNWSTYRIAKLNQDAEEEQDDDDTGDEADRDGEADVDMIWGEGGDDDDEDSSSESDISFEAALNRDEDADKFAYGLVVHPAEAEGRYFRVGVFTSWPKGRGGLKRFFQGRDARTIEII